MFRSTISLLFFYLYTFVCLKEKRCDDDVSWKKTFDPRFFLLCGNVLMIWHLSLLLFFYLLHPMKMALFIFPPM